MAESHSGRLARVLRPISGDALRYVQVGCLNAAVDFGLNMLLTYGVGMAPAYANLISRPAGGLLGFFLHKHHTFQNRADGSARAQFARFWLVWFLSFTTSQGLVVLYSNVLHWSPLLTKVAAEGGAVLVSFTCLRWWAFRTSAGS